ncbi:MAG: hypothetical protein DRN17_01765 [Thermoplasmata archaeon]|nr:MAG: hypothetical protein DRN17_01765 [Thermoplasmata archaeon]
MNKEESSFLDTIVNYAMVVRTDLGTIQKIKKDILQLYGVNVVYQKMSIGMLFIKEESDTNDEQ